MKNRKSRKEILVTLFSTFQKAALINRRQNRAFESGNLATTAPQVQAELAEVNASILAVQACKVAL
ncbi:hypothetical protein LGH70_05060 [Hymenobacter sp. BT635]|uniref:Lacal_2735 family protein n=1 Tax=Hymenobacter nitidus TaxID=2880929 RepID=A0ABS8AC10_9BACT|nr:hypothetical protein [Hymenobacter nitidus]MCB2376939.1 hypothetical protein [Hymenobacter nitidus]